jgi:hypothetical protein
MDIKDGVTTSSKEQLRSLVRVYKLDEITPNGCKYRSVTKEHPWGLKRKRPDFMQGEPPSWMRGWNRQNGASGGAKCINTWGPTGAKGRPNRAGMGLGQSAQAGRPGPLRGSVRPPFSCTWRSFNPKLLEVPPFARERAIRMRGHPQARENRREIIRERDRSTRRKHPQVETKKDTVGSITMINGAMSSTLMG